MAIDRTKPLAASQCSLGTIHPIHWGKPTALLLERHFQHNHQMASGLAPMYVSKPPQAEL